jgi:hypothetical protein
MISRRSDYVGRSDVQHGFEFLGYKIKRGKKLRLPESKIRSQARSGALYAYLREKSIQRFQDQVRQRTKRRVPLHTKELNPLLRGRANITNEPTSESSSINSTDGSRGGSGRIDLSVGGMAVGCNCLRPRCTVSMSL